MLNRVSWQMPIRDAAPQMSERQEPVIDLAEVYCALRRRSGLIAAILASAIAGASAYLMVTPPRFTASAMLLFDVRKIEPFPQQGSGNAAADSAYIDSQVEVLKSENLARAVIRKLNLVSDPELAPSEAGLFAPLQRLTGGTFDSASNRQLPTPEIDESFKALLGPDAAKLGRVVRVFQANLMVKRIGLTYVVSISYRSRDPDKSARISNAVAEAYLAGELESKYHAARRANAWLQDRVNELKLMAQNTERAVAEYKKKMVVDTDAAHMSEQQLADLSSQRRIVLQDLESSAQTYRALHETLLQRVAEFTQQQSFPATDARVVSPASAPLEKSDPKPRLVLGAAFLLGLVGGLGVALAREYLHRGLRTPHQVEKTIGVSCLGMLPTISVAQASRDQPRRHWWTANWLRRRETGADPTGQVAAEGGDRIIANYAGRYRFALDRPASAFAETIRSLAVAAEVAASRGHNKVFGVTSALPREGKSLVAANLSALLAASGSKTLLIDADPCHPGLTQLLAPEAKAGLMHAAGGEATVEDLAWRDPQVGFEFLPTTSGSKAGRLTGMVPFSSMRKVLESVQHRYDHVVVDLPPISSAAQVTAASHLADHFILVIEWERTSYQDVMDALNATPLVPEKLLGAVLNKVDPGALR